MDQNTKDITTAAHMIQMYILVTTVTCLIYTYAKKNDPLFFKKLLMFIGEAKKALNEEEKKELETMIDKTTEAKMKEFLSNLKRSLNEKEFQEAVKMLADIINKDNEVLKKAISPTPIVSSILK